MNNPATYDAIIVGGGPAGSSAAIHLATAGAHVMLIEQKKFPRAKLCGEFISPECFDHFEKLGVAGSMLDGSARLTETVFYSRNGNSVNVPSKWFGNRSISAIGLSRSEMDHRLLNRARETGVDVLENAKAERPIVINGRVSGVLVKLGKEHISPAALLVVDATGRSRTLARKFEETRTGRRKASANARLVAFKAHMTGTRRVDDHCEIYFYKGGYGGLSRVEAGVDNLCFIVKANDVKTRSGAAERVMREIVMSNRRAAVALRDARPCSEWLSVAIERFGKYNVVPASGMLAIGDAAAFIDPFTGSGMLMALESGQLAATTVKNYLGSLRRGESFDDLAKDYCSAYEREFNARLRMCSIMRRSAFFSYLPEAMIFALQRSEVVRRRLAQATRKLSVQSTAPFS